MSNRKPVLVTGASRGLGLAMALRLARAGFQVWAGYRNPADSRRLVRSAGEAGVAVRPVSLDVTSEESVRAAVEALAREAGTPHAVVNNAGIAVRGYFEDLSDEEVRRVFEVNLFGAMRVTRAVLPLLRRARRGRVLMVSSIAGRIGAPTLAAYVSSKFALEGFAECLALEVAPLGIHVSIVEPGIVETEIWDPQRRVAAAAARPGSPYSEWFRSAEHLANTFVRASRLTPEAVADRVLQVINARRPRLRYLIGRKAGAVVALRRHLPGELFERIYFGEQLRRITRGTVS